MLTIGSLALKAHGFDLGRQPRDIDYVCTFEEYQSWISAEKSILRAYYPLSGNKFVAFSKQNGDTIFEFEIAWPGSTAEDLLLMHAGKGFATPEVCLALKMSHRYLKNSPAFLKTMKDIWLMRSAGVRIPEYLQSWLKRREHETYSYKHPNLKQSKMNFFDASVKYTYDHDAIHRAVAYLDQPAYTYYKDDQAEVFCSKDKFFALGQETRLYGVAEEAYVLALERSLIPHPGVLTPKQAFELALMKVCTSITSGWFREFAWENYFDVVRIYNPDYFKMFEIALADGKIPLADSAGMV